jgi:hypothetical protein
MELFSSSARAIIWAATGGIGVSVSIPLMISSIFVILALLPDLRFD